MAEKGQESRPSLSKTNEETISSPRGNTWGYEETVSLLEVWAEDTMQRDLENTPKRNMDTYKKIVEQINAQMRENGHSFKRTPVECRSRVKRLITQYFKTKEVNKKSGSRRTSFPDYERMDRLLGRRPIVEPVAQYDSMNCAGDRSDRRLDVESVDGSEVDFTGL
jgi:hypothetical protein